MRKLIILMLLLFAGSCYAEKSLMRLFYSPAERAEINAVRKAPATEAGPAKNVQPSTDEIEMKGFIKRSDNSKVVWINDKNTLKTNKPYDDVKVLRVNKEGRVKISVTGEGVVYLKPGEVLSRSQNRKLESYEK